jgi:hypothetical protein
MVDQGEDQPVYRGVQRLTRRRNGERRLDSKGDDPREDEKQDLEDLQLEVLHPSLPLGIF